MYVFFSLHKSQSSAGECSLHTSTDPFPGCTVFIEGQLQN